MAAFEESLIKLEDVVAKLEGGDLALEDSVKLYEEGIRLSELCKSELDKAEGRIQVLMKGKGGRVEARNFDLAQSEEL